MATNENNLDAYNEVATTLGGAGGDLNDMVAVRAIAVLEGVSGGPADVNDDNMILRLNAIDVGAGGPGGHLNTLDALNSIVVLKGGVGGHENDLDAINEWVDNAGAGGVLLVDMIAYYRLEEASGTRFDAHTNNLDLTDNNTVTSEAGKQGQAAVMVVANSEFLSHVNDVLLQMGDIDFTIAGWWKPVDQAAAYAIVCKDFDSVSREYRIDMNSGAGPRWIVFDASGNVVGIVENTTTTIVNGTYFWVLVEHDAAANRVRIQINNATAEEAATTGTLAVHTAPFEIGRFNTTIHANASFDEFAIWKRLLTAAEKTFLYNSDAGRSFAEISAF